MANVSVTAADLKVGDVIDSSGDRYLDGDPALNTGLHAVTAIYPDGSGDRNCLWIAFDGDQSTVAFADTHVFVVTSRPDAATA
jgi:hypothetical protein